MHADQRLSEVDGFQGIVTRFPLFEPHPLLPNGHAQTIVASVFGGRRFRYRASQHVLLLEDGDAAILHDDRPGGWQPSSPVALLIHGLAGCAESPYMIRVAGRLNEAGVRTFRMDMRACGAGEGLSSMPYHAGCSHDLAAALEHVVRVCPFASVSLVGFSIGGNIVLKLLGEQADALPPQLQRAIVFNPPIDLLAAVNRLESHPGRIYDRHLVWLLYRQLNRSERLIERAPYISYSRRPRSLREFDGLYTAAVWGFETVEEFYAQTSSAPHIPHIRVPTLVISSRDDPLVPASLFEQLSPPPTVSLCLTEAGGHLGFIARPGIDRDCRWMDWRIVDWVTADMKTASPAAVA